MDPIFLFELFAFVKITRAMRGFKIPFWAKSIYSFLERKKF